jgi:hypothetical protein
VLTIPVNLVQNFNDNVHGNISAEFLNGKFLDDYIIDLDTYDGFKNISCHQEVEFGYIKLT